MSKIIDQMSIIEIENHLMDRRHRARPTVGDLKKAIATLSDSLPLGIVIFKGDVDLHEEREEQYEMVTHIVVSELGVDVVCDEPALDADIDGPGQYAGMYSNG